MKILRLKIENLRSLASVEFELNHPGISGRMRYPNVNVILGGNGSGKTSILRAAALAVLGPLMSRSSGYVPEGLIRRPPGSAGRFNLRRGASSAMLPPATAQAEIRIDKSELSKYVGRWPTVITHPLRIGSQIEFLGTSERMEWGINPP